MGRSGHRQPRKRPLPTRQPASRAAPTDSGTHHQIDPAPHPYRLPAVTIRVSGVGRNVSSEGRLDGKIDTVTLSAELTRCPWCAAVIPSQNGPGRPRRFCRRSHRQRHYEARRLAAAQGLAPDEVLISRRQFDEWRDRIYLLEAALEDAEQDLGDEPTLREYTEAFKTLYEAASRTKAFQLEARALGAE